MHTMSRLAIAMLLMTSVCAPQFAGASAVVSSAELKFREQMALVDYQKVEYRDEKGAVISYEEFAKKLPSMAFGMEKMKKGDQGSAVVKLEAKTAKPMNLPKFKLKPGEEFPAFKLRASDDSLIDNAALKGRYTVVNFYFADCAPCIKEVPMLNEFIARNKEYGALAITFDSPEETKKFVRRTSFNWRTVTDAGDLLNQIGVKTYPSFALLDPKGMVVAISNGFEASTLGFNLDKWVEKAIATRAQ